MRNHSVRYGKCRLVQFGSRKIHWISKDSTRKMRFAVRAAMTKIGA